MVNLFLASVYDSFMLHTGIKDKSKEVQKEFVVEEEKKIEEINFFINLGKIFKKEESTESKKTIVKRNENSGKDKKKTIFPMQYYMNSNFLKGIYFKSCRKFILNIFNKNWFVNLISLLIIGDIIVLCLDEYPISNSKMIFLHQLDFFFFSCFFVEITAKIFAAGLNSLKSSYIFVLDVIIIYANSAILIYEIAVGFNIFEEGSKLGIGIKTIKMIRIIRVIYYTESFSSLSLLLKALVKTLNKMKQFFLIMLGLVTVFALIGKKIFAYRARFIETDNGGFIYAM